VQQTITIVINGSGEPVVTSHTSHTDKRRDFGPGRVIFTAGSEAAFSYVIKSGSVRLDGDGMTRTINEGCVIGEEALLGQPYEVTATAITEVEIDVVDAAKFLADVSGEARDFLVSLANTNQELLAERQVAHISNLKVRLSNLIEQILDREGKEIGKGWWRIERQIKHHVIATMIGAKRATVSAYFSHARAAGVLRDTGENLDVDREGLRAFLVKQ
jgi:CRP-like cAMP-binding protein